MKDFVIRGAKTVDEKEIDIIVEKGKIVAFSKEDRVPEKTLIDASGFYVSSGWIDMHTHAFAPFDPYGDEIDEIGIKQGVTTIVDAGSCGANQIEDLLSKSKEAKTNLLAFLNISEIGLKRADELSNLAWIDQAKVKQTVQAFSDKIVGLKARISQSVVGENGITPLRIARLLSHEIGLPLMVHIGSAPPNIKEIIPLLEKRDILTHYLHGKPNNLFDEEKKPLLVFQQAIKRGVHLDVGHGSASFSFSVAQAAKSHHIHFDTISTDIYRSNRLHGPVYSLAHVLTKFLWLGYSLPEVIAAVTKNAARWLDKPEWGRIQIGDVANLTLFQVVKKPITLTDANGKQVVSSVKLEPKGVVINGEYRHCES